MSARRASLTIREPLTGRVVVRVTVNAEFLRDLRAGHVGAVPADGASFDLGDFATDALAAAAAAGPEGGDVDVRVDLRHGSVPVRPFVCVEAGVPDDDAHAHVAGTPEAAAELHAERYVESGPDGGSMPEVVDVFVRDLATGETTAHRVVQGYFPLRRVAKPGSPDAEEAGPMPELTDADREALDAGVAEFEAAGGGTHGPG